MKNRFGLSRSIPEEIKKNVRKKFGFGCVICGSAYYHYDHYAPEFKDATKHTSDGITLLCASHHDMKTRGMLSNLTLTRAVAEPFCNKKGFSHGPLDLSTEWIVVQIGSTLFLNSTNIICIDGEPILSIKKPDEINTPFLLTLVTGELRGSNRIKNNEWIGNAKSWDIEIKANRIVVRNEKKSVILELENIPGEKFIIHQMDIVYKNYRISTKTISTRQIGNVQIFEQKILTIINPKGIEIARIGSDSDKLNEMNWETALEVEDEYMSSSLKNAHIKGGTFNLLLNNKKSIEIIGNNFNGTNLSIGRNKLVTDFVHQTNFLIEKYIKVKGNKFKINPKETSALKNAYRMLKHTELIKQLPKEEIEYVKDFLHRI